MRTFSLSLFALFLFTAVNQAQPPVRPLPPARSEKPAVDPKQSELDQHLLRWQEEVQKIQTFKANCGWTEKSPITKLSETFKGLLYFKRNSKDVKFLLHVNKLDPITKQPDKDEFQRILYTGNFLYQYVPAQKEVHVYSAPKNGLGAGQQQTALEFFFKMDAVKAKERFDLKLAKVDQHYVYIDIFPKYPKDKAEFLRARAVLIKSTMVPRQLWFKSANEEEVLWDVPVLQSNTEIPEKTFQFQEVKGWKVRRQKSPAKTGPTIRNQNP